jgi:hypothetical protein
LIVGDQPDSCDQTGGHDSHQHPTGDITALIFCPLVEPVKPRNQTNV